MSDYSIVINAGSIVLLPPELERQQRLDVLESVLFAQMVAAKKYPGFQQAILRYDAYREVLKNGWLQRAAAWKEFTPAAASFNVPAWLCAQLSEHVEQAAIDKVTRALKDVAQLSCTLPGIKLLCETACQQGTPASPSVGAETVYKVCMQIIFVQPGPTLSSVYVAFETTEHITANPLAQVFASDRVVGNIRLRYFKANLSAALYEPVRLAITRKLGDKASTNIIDISHIAQGDGEGAVCS